MPRTLYPEGVKIQKKCNLEMLHFLLQSLKKFRMGLARPRMKLILYRKIFLTFSKRKRFNVRLFIISASMNFLCCS